MKRLARLRTRRPRPGGASVQLFPFLAVLLCTMGSLIVVLVLITRQARQQAACAAEIQAAEQATQLQSNLEEVQWRTEQLKVAREKTASQLHGARATLGQIEDHARRLAEKAQELEAALRELERDRNNAGGRRAELEAEAGRLRLQIEAAESELRQAEQAAAQQPQRYSVVPYDGPNPTSRRPIYIECRENSVILQPEGIVLRAEDFEGPMGPGNPLASAMRAIREYLVGQGAIDPARDGEPYPLLLVRPGGIEAYYAARAAISSWGAEFGYQFIEDDWQLDYPPGDSRLAQVVGQTVAVARVEQQRLIAAAPREYEQPKKPLFRASAGRGGVVLEEGTAEDAARALGRGGSRPFPSTGSTASGRGGSGYGGDSRQSGSGPAGYSGTTTGLSGSERGGFAGSDDEADHSQELAQLYGNADSLPVGDGRGVDPARGNPALGQGSDGTPFNPADARGGQPYASEAHAPRLSGPTGVSNGVGSAAGQQQQVAAGMLAQPDPGATGAGGGTPRRPGEWQESGDASLQGEACANHSLAEARGENWG
ncbi:MAG: hypothetical protein ACOY3P_04075, partial [Planctomycetota bacterium]